MKNVKILSLLALLFCVGLITSCSDDEEEEVLPPAPTVISEGGEAFVGFESTFPVQVNAQGNVETITAEVAAGGGTVSVQDLEGVGSTSATATVAYTPDEVGTATITITATDAEGQEASADISVEINAEPSEVVIADATVVPDNDEIGGKVAVVVEGGVTPYSYEWNSGETTEEIAGVSAGEYTVTVTDAIGQTVSETYVVEDLTGQVVMIDGDENVYTTTLYDGYYWTNSDITSLSAADGTEFSNIQNVEVPLDPADPVLNVDNAYAVSDMEAVVFDAVVHFLNSDGDELTAETRQYTWAAANELCAEGWTWPVKNNVSYQEAGDAFTFAPTSSAWSGYGWPTGDATAIFDLEDPTFFAGQKRNQNQIDDETREDGQRTYWPSAGGAKYIWAGYLPADEANFLNADNGNGNVMFMDNGGTYAFFGNHNTGSAACRCVKQQ